MSWIRGSLKNLARSEPMQLIVRSFDAAGRLLVELKHPPYVESVWISTKDTGNVHTVQVECKPDGEEEPCQLSF